MRDKALDLWKNREVRIYIQLLKNHRSRKTWSGVKYLSVERKNPLT